MMPVKDMYVALSLVCLDSARVWLSCQAKKEIWLFHCYIQVGLVFANPAANYALSPLCKLSKVTSSTLYALFYKNIIMLIQVAGFL